MCILHLNYTVRPCLIRTCHAMPMPCSDHAVLLKATSQHGRREGTCWLTSRVRLLPAIKRSYTKVLIRRITISDAGGHCETEHRLSLTRNIVVASHYKKDDLLPVRIFPATMQTFTMGYGVVGAGQGRGMACVN